MLAASPSTATSSPRNGVVIGMKTPSQLRIGRPFRRVTRLDPRLCGAEACDRDHERRTGHVRHVHSVTDLDRRGLPAMLAADPDLEAGARPPPPPHPHPDHPSPPLLAT